jgi:alpha-tubulin suppressor-like RCC1 family protein
VRARAAALAGVLALVALAGLSAASPAAADDAQISRYVRHVYLDLFGREPDPTGMATWSAALRNGTPRVAVANAITHSEEFRTGLITDTYEHFLGRGPDPQGLRFWLGQMARGATISQISSGFLASDEYYARAGNNPHQWVRNMYVDVLGRAASNQEAVWWAIRFAQPGNTRATVSLGILLSEEHLAPIVEGYYQQLLGRGLDPTGRGTWIGKLQAGVHDEEIIGGIVASQEYWIGSAEPWISGFAIVPGATTATAGTRVGYRAVLLDEDDNVARDVTGAATFAISVHGNPLGLCEGASCWGVTAGPYTVTATWQGNQDSVGLDVTNGPAVRTGIRLLGDVANGQLSVPADVSISVALWADDGWTNSWPVTSGLTPTLDGVPCTQRCGPITAGPHTISAVPAPGSGLPAPERSITVTGVTPVNPGSRMFSWGVDPTAFGDGSTAPRATPTQVGTGTWWWSVAAGDEHVLASRTDRSIWTWGADDSGQLGTGDEPRDLSRPLWMEGTRSIDGAGVLSADGASSLTVLAGGITLGWGDNEFGQTGFGDVGNYSALPRRVDETGLGTLWFQTASMGGSVAAGIEENRLLTWGSNEYGQLGDGTRVDRPRPGYVGTDTWTAVAAGESHVVAVRSDGTLWQWGLLAGGVVATVPQQVGVRTDWASVDAGFDLSAALTTSGELWTWGSNGDGQLGDGTTTDRTAPVRIGAGTTWTKVSFGLTHTAAIATDGSLWTWGRDAADGVGGAPAHVAPTRVGSDAGWTDVAAGAGFTVALRP